MMPNQDTGTLRYRAVDADPRGVAARIVVEHGVLRALLAEVASASRSGPAADVRSLAEQLTMTLEQHLRYEEAEVFPVLYRADAWGPVQVARLARDHGEQRSMVRALAAAVRDGRSREEIVAAIDTLRDRLERDMRDEEERVATSR